MTGSDYLYQDSECSSEMTESPWYNPLESSKNTLGQVNDASINLKMIDKELEGSKTSEDSSKIEWKSIHKSWYPAPVLTIDEYKYLKMIEAVFKVMNPSGEWISIKLTNHQAEFHANDIAIKGYDAKNEVIIKSRNTSYTTNLVIRTLCSIFDYRDQIIPAIRINDTKVMELISTVFYDLIKHMTPLEFEIEKEGKIIKDYWPFNNKLVKFTAHNIEFPDRNVTITGYPANSSASENIRGLRINLGFADEVNFILSFQNIDAAMVQAARGEEISGENIGKKQFQVTYGTTRKGRFTSFNIWLEQIERLIEQHGELIDWKIYKWPALDPTKVNLKMSLTEQKGLVPIVPWHTIQKLETARLKNINIFKEEYMAMLVDEDDKLYNVQFIKDNLLNDRKNELYNDLEGEWYIGIDPAYSQDLFAVSVFNKEYNEEINESVYNQYGVFYQNKVDLTDMQDKCEDLLQYYLSRGMKMMTIDGHGLGVQLSNYLKKRYPQHVRVIRNTRIKAGKDISISAKEFIHTNQIELQNKKRVKYLNDNMQLLHFSGWDLKYEFDRNYSSGFGEEIGHGDTTISNGLAILPLNIHNIRNDGNGLLIGNILNQFRINDEEIEKENNTEIYEHKELTVDDKLEFYSKLRKKGGLL